MSAQELAAFLKTNISALIAAIVDNNPNAVKTNLAARGINFGLGTNADLMTAVAKLFSNGDKKTGAAVLSVPFIAGVLPPEYDAAFGIIYANTPRKKTVSDFTSMNWGDILCSIMGTCPDTNITNVQAPAPDYTNIYIGVGVAVLLIIALIAFLVLR